MVAIDRLPMSQAGENQLAPPAVTGKVVMGDSAKCDDEIGIEDIFSKTDRRAATGYTQVGKAVPVGTVVVNKPVTVISRADDPNNEISRIELVLVSTPYPEDDNLVAGVTPGKGGQFFDGPDAILPSGVVQENVNGQPGQPLGKGDLF